MATSSDNTKIRLVVYGSSKVGKTFLGMTFPRPIYVINTDEGLEGDAVEGLVRGKDYVERNPANYTDLEECYREVKKGDFATIMFDSMTVLAAVLLGEIHDLGLVAKPATSAVMRWTPEIQEYGAVSRQAFRVLIDFRRLGRHMVVTAQRREGGSKKGPDVIPSVMSVLSHWCNVIGELEVVTHDPKTHKELDKAVRVLYTSPRSDREAGSRFRVLSPRVLNPSFDKMWAAINSGPQTQPIPLPEQEKSA